MVNNPFTHFLGWCTRVWLDFPEINLPHEISMIVSKTRKKLLMTFHVVNSEGFWYPRQENQSAFFIRHQVKPPKKIALFNRFYLSCWEKDGCWHGRFHVKMKVTGKFSTQHEILPWFMVIFNTVVWMNL